MTDPIQPKYGPPFDPNSTSSGGSDSDTGKDLSYLVPDLSVAWPAPHSFNEDPPKDANGRSSGDSAADDAPSCGDISIDLSTLMSALTSMLGTTRTAVDDFESLRNAFLSTKDTIYGQEEEPFVGTDAGSGGGSIGTGVSVGTTYNSPVRDPARQFANEINPALEKALFQVGGALEVVGQYIAALDRSGQFYGEADRAAMFPNAPARPDPSVPRAPLPRLLPPWYHGFH
jgi:hypothetical protein